MSSLRLDKLARMLPNEAGMLEELLRQQKTHQRLSLKWLRSRGRQRSFSLSQKAQVSLECKLSMPSEYIHRRLQCLQSLLLRRSTRNESRSLSKRSAQLRLLSVQGSRYKRLQHRRGMNGRPYQRTRLLTQQMLELPQPCLHIKNL